MDWIKIALIVFATLRILVGLTPFVGLSLLSKFGVPPSENTALARLMGRLFGIRDAAIGGLLLWAALCHPIAVSVALLIGIAIDFLDAAAIAISLIKREGLDRFAKISIGLALSGTATGVVLWWLKFGCQACAHH